MPTLRETVTTALPRDDAFAFIADFANAPVWDPGTATAERINPGPVGVGARYRLGVRMRGNVVPMEYRIVGHEPGAQVVLEGKGSGVRARDEISFASTPAGTQVDYVAEIHLTGLLRLIEPLLGSQLAKIGRDARAGMQRALDERSRDTARSGDTAGTGR